MSTEIPTGLASVEASQGFEPLVEDKKKDDGLTVEQAAAAHTKPVESILVRSLDLPDNTTLTIEQAHEKLSELRAADSKAKEVEEEDKLTQKVDKEREPIEAPKAEKESASVETDDIETTFRKHPKVREALMQEATANESARTEFKQATDAALSIGRASFLEGFPEFANLPMTHWENALRAMHQREPQRFNKAVAILQRVGAAEQMQTNLKAHEAREFKNYVASENQKFAERHKGEKLDPSAVMETLKSVGVDPTTFLKEYDGSRILRSAEAQAIMVKAAKYDALMKKQEAARNAPKPKPAARAVAPVIRPGASQPRANQSAMDARTLMGRLEQSGSLDDAVRAINAKRAASKTGKR